MVLSGISMVEKVKSTKTINKTVEEEVQVDVFKCSICGHAWEIEGWAEDCEEHHKYENKPEHRVQEVQVSTIFTLECGSCSKTWEETVEPSCMDLGSLAQCHPYECPHCKDKAYVPEHETSSSEWIT